jgi:hypothetical protein
VVLSIPERGAAHLERKVEDGRSPADGWSFPPQDANAIHTAVSPGQTLPAASQLLDASRNGDPFLRTTTEASSFVRGLSM